MFEILPREEPSKIISVEIQPDSIKRLATGYLAFGSSSPARLAEWAGMTPERVEHLLESHQFCTLLRQVRAKPELVLPGRSELFALMVIEAERAEKSRDRQMAIKTLLELAPVEAPSLIQTHLPGAELA